jgi:hypothetical protein
LYSLEAIVDEFDQPTEITETEARQGVTLNVMRLVLVFGIIGAVLALLIAGLIMT